MIYIVNFIPIFPAFLFYNILIFYIYKLYFINKFALPYNPLRYEILEFEKLYYEEFSSLNESNLSNKQLFDLKNKYVELETPFGIVILSYDFDTECFIYYADSTNISFKSLDSIARYFVIENNCKQICVDYKNEWTMAKQNALLMKFNPSNNENKVNKDPVFASFKPYNTLSNKINPSLTKHLIQTEKCNRFTYKGKLSEFNKSNCVPQTNIPSITYKDYVTLET